MPQHPATPGSVPDPLTTKPDRPSTPSTPSVAPPPGAHPPGTRPPAAHVSRADPPGVGVLRHLGSLVLAVVLVPMAVLLLDQGWVRFQRAGVAMASDDVGVLPRVLLVGGALVLLVAVLAARLSGLGPLVVGLGCGVLGVWALAAPTGYLRTVLDLLRPLPSSQGFPWGYGLLSSGALLFPLLAAVLVGAGVAGRWHRSRVRGG